MKRGTKRDQRCEPPHRDPDFEIVDAALPVNSKITIYGIHIHKIEIEDNEGVTFEEKQRLEATLGGARDVIAALRKQKDFWETAAQDRTEERNQHGREVLRLKDELVMAQKRIAADMRVNNRLTQTLAQLKSKKKGAKRK